MRQTIRIFLALMLISYSSCTKKEAKAPPVIDFKTHYTINPSFDPKSSMVTVAISLDKPLHAYADGEKIGRPVRLEITKKNGWAADGPAIAPKGVTKQLPGLGESVVLQGNFELKQKVIRGHGPGEAKLYLQVCTDTACDQPREHILQITNK